MNADFYAVLLSLSPEDREELDILAREDDCQRRTVADCAITWRQYRADGITPQELRRMYLVRSALAASQYVAKNNAGSAVTAAFAFYLCDQIEQQVWLLDQGNHASSLTKGGFRL